MTEKIETIDGVAVKTKSGPHGEEKVWSLFRPARHHNVLALIRRELEKKGIDPEKIIRASAGAEQGFITSRGRFVSRREAAEIAVKADQCLDIESSPRIVDGKTVTCRRGPHFQPGVLFSEDVW